MRRSLQLAMTLALTLGLPLLSAAPAAASPIVETLLSGIDTVPRAAEWQRLDPSITAAELRAVADDASRRLTTRARAVAALRYFPAAATRTYLEGLLAQAQAPSLLRRKAALSLAAGFGEAAIDALAAQADAADVRLRDDVARALGTVGTPKAKTILRARLEQENTFVRGTIERSLGETRAEVK